MDGLTLQNLMAKGMGVAGRVLGSPFTVYRPSGPCAPISPANQVIALDAAFRDEGYGLPRAPDYGKAVWWGMYDTSYTMAGDYLVGCEGTYFVAAQRLGLPVQCVFTNRVATIVRPVASAQSGYSGFFASPGGLVISDWPASLLEAGSHGAVLRPGETRLGTWEMLLPKLPVMLQVADVVTDDLGVSYVVGLAEQSALGWRVALRQLAA